MRTAQERSGKKRVNFPVGSMSRVVKQAATPRRRIRPFYPVSPAIHARYAALPASTGSAITSGTWYG